MLHLCRASLAIIALLWPGLALPQGATGAFPSRPVTFIIPLAAGGPVDGEVRLYSAKAAEVMGQPFLMDFKPGAAGTIAAGYVAKAAPDGHTLLVVSGSFPTFSILYRNLPFDPLLDLAPLTLMSKRPQLLLVSPAFPGRNITDYVNFAKANPAKINFGTTGEGSGTHLGGAWLHSATNTRVTFVHYKGTGPLLPDLMAGRLDVTLAALSVSLPLTKAGKVRALAMLGDKRTPLLPDLPTVAEQTVPGYDYSGWTGFSAPGATPQAIVNRLNQGFIKVARLPEVSAALEASGNVAVGSTPAEFRQLLVIETDRWKKVAQEVGIKPEG